LPLLTIDADATRRALPFPALIAALRRAFAAGAEVPRRQVLSVEGTDRPSGTFLVMPAWRPGAYLGIKTVAVFPGNAARGQATLHASYLLNDATTGAPLALIDGDEITARRTVAASALAASFLARTDATRLLVVGAGRIAALLPEAMASVRPIARVGIWSRRPEPAERLATTLRGQGVEAFVEPDLRAAVGAADIVSCATLSTAPLVHGEWLREGSHLDLIGSFTPAMREADAAAVARSRVFVDTVEALEKSGDLLEAVAAGAFAADALQGTLETLCRGAQGRAESNEITLFKSVGSALEDLAAAELVFESARAAGAPLS
jgi:ornithine cyclodeaminase/alanine dehydrogenase-like protein (mu-crystallin family)